MTTKKHKRLSAAQIRAMNDLGPYTVINEPPKGTFHVIMDGERLYGMTTGSQSMTYTEAQRTCKAYAELRPHAHLQITVTK